MTRWRGPVPWAAGLALGLLPLFTAAAPSPTTPCPVPGLDAEVRCGTVPRPLDPARPDGPQISVHYIVVPSGSRDKRPDPVVLLAGGPGQSAIALAGQVMPLLGRLNARRDVLLVDQRGTGRSAPLMCPEPTLEGLAERADPDRQLRRLRACRQQLQHLPYGDLRFFTTPLASQDLDAVRAAVGAERLNLIGVSYGSRAGLDYLRQFPDRVRRLVLDGVTPPDMVLPRSVGRDNQAALDALWRSCEQEAACAARYPGLRAAWRAWLARLPQAVTVQHPVSGVPESFRLTRAMALGAVRSALYVPSLSQALPAALQQAFQGHPQALLTLGLGLAPDRRGEVAAGMHFSVICSEDFGTPGLAPDGAAEARPHRGDDFGDDSLQMYRRACEDWPRGVLPAAFYQVPVSPVPVLLLSGGLDPATPPRHAARVAAALGPQARQVVVPNAGHGVLGLGCMPERLTRFITTDDAASALRLDTGCVEGIPRPLAFQPVVGGSGR